MAVHIILITHDHVGTALLKTVTKTYGQLPLPTISVPITEDCDPDSLIPKLKNLLENIDTLDGVLILTDLYGATPSNIANQLQNDKLKIKVVTGVNLPMLIHLMNYPNNNLEELAEKAMSAGKKGVHDCCIENIV
jgi:PTS system ascorbate-specific IIA component